MLSRINSQQEQLARSEAKSTISMLVASVSHELGTPLSNCVMSASTLNDLGIEFKAKLDAGQLHRQDLDEFIDLLSQMSSLLQRNLLRACNLMQNFKQVAADQASEQRRQFELTTMLNEILATMAPGLRNKPHRIALDIPESICLDSYPGAIGQVVINLVNNAYLHAFEGKSNGLLTIRARLEQDLLYLSFEDNGVGISAENLIKIRSPFSALKLAVAVLA